MAGKSNMELLLRDEDRIDSVLSKWWNPAAAATIGLVSIVFLRAFQRRPLYSGIQAHVLTSVGCFIAGYHLDQYRNGYLAERDAVLRNYLERHPEDFPEPGQPVSPRGYSRPPVTNQQSVLHIIPEESRPHLHHGGSQEEKVW